MSAFASDDEKAPIHSNESFVYKYMPDIVKKVKDQIASKE